MFSIFYDLETTDKNPIGQILNYCFILVDQDFAVVEELSGLVRISRLQLPDAGAILANRVNVLDHQRQAVDEEPSAVRAISQFFQRCIERAGGVVSLVGYNSSRFDLNYLRTTFIRNGVSPYYQKNLPPRDLLHTVQKAYLTSARFRQLVVQERGNEARLSLSLQTVARALGLLSGNQAHESREDVELTIRVAQWLKSECELDVRTFEAYQGGGLHPTARSGAVYNVSEVEYDLSAGSHEARSPVIVLDADYRSSLWVHLRRFQERRDASAIMWRSASKHAFFVDPRAQSDSELASLAREALTAFKGVSLKNFFSKSTCDIEQDIYRLDFDALKAFSGAVESMDRSLLGPSPSPELKVLWARYRLRHSGASLSDPKCSELLRQYALHRYGGKLQLCRVEPTLPLDKQGEARAYHATLRELLLELRQQRSSAEAQGRTEDRVLLDALEAFYRASDIVKVAGSDLQWD